MIRRYGIGQVGVLAAALSLATTCGPDGFEDAAIPTDAAMNGDAGAGRPDAGQRHDGGDAEALGPGWMDVPETESCLQVARRPEATLAALPIRVCTDARGECREVDVTWDAPARPVFRLRAATYLSSGGVIAFSRAGADGWTETLVARLDGTVEAAFRGRSDARLCVVGPVALSESRVVIGIYRFTPEEGVAPPIVVSAPRSAPNTATVLRAFTMTESLGGPQYLMASDEVVAMETTGTDIWRIELDGAATLVGGPGRGGGESHLDAVIEDAVFFHGFGPAGLLEIRASTTGGTDTLVSAAADDVALLRTDGEDMVWQRLIDPQPDVTWRGAELWTAPFSTTGPVIGRSVRSFEISAPYSFVAMGAGRVIVAEADGAASVYSAADGSLIETLTSADEAVDPSHAYSTVGEMGFGLTTAGLLPGHRTFRWVTR